MELDFKAIIGSYAQITIFLLMFSIGLGEGLNNLSILWRRPSLLVRCLIASFILVPLAAMLILRIVPMDQPARIGLGLMAICPGAPLMYKKLTSMKANTALAGSFQVTTSLFAILVVPLWIAVLSALYPADAAASTMDVFKQVATVQLIPILLGLAIREWLPSLADDLMEPIQKISSFMFLGVVIILLIVALPRILKVGVVTIIGVVLFIAAAIVIGHYLGGPDPDTRLTIALANSTRNAGLALALATMNFDNPGILAAIAAIALLTFVADAIYTNLYRKQLGQRAQPSASGN
jgi:BASS family bile acid:Na+ symporter